MLGLGGGDFEGGVGRPDARLGGRLDRPADQVYVGGVGEAVSDLVMRSDLVGGLKPGFEGAPRVSGVVVGVLAHPSALVDLCAPPSCQSVFSVKPVYCRTYC